MRHAVALAGGLAATWFLWSGHTEPLILGFGIASVALVVWFASRLDVLDDEGVPLAVLQPGWLWYGPWLFSRVVLSNWDVSRRVWMGGPISPRMLTVSPAQNTWIGRVLFANSITLTPGTVSVRMYDGEILVHALHEDAADEVLAADMNRRVAALEGRP